MPPQIHSLFRSELVETDAEVSTRQQLYSFQMRDKFNLNLTWREKERKWLA